MKTLDFFQYCSSLEIIHVYCPLCSSSISLSVSGVNPKFILRGHIAIMKDKSFISMNHHSWITINFNQDPYIYFTPTLLQVKFTSKYFLCHVVYLDSTGP